MSSPEDWPNESGTGELPGVEVVHGDGHEWVRRKETVIIPLRRTTPGGTSGLQPVPKRGLEKRGTRAVRAASCGFSSAAALIYFY